MYKKILFIIIFTFTMIGAKKGLGDVTTNIILEENTLQENKATQNIDNSKTLAEEPIAQEMEKNVLNPNTNPKERQSVDNIDKNVERSNEITQLNIKTTQEVNSGNEGKQINTVTSNKKDNKQDEKTIQNKNAKENETVQEAKVEYVYNSTETQRIINDINTIAKRNPDIYDENGNKIYNIKKFSNVETAMQGTNYFSPYRQRDIEGVVLNAYPCTFLVYAIDYKINGVVQNTRYYIKVTEYEK